MTRKGKCGAQPPDRHFILAEAVDAFYGSQWGEKPVEWFRQEVEPNRTRLRKRNQLDWMIYVIRLILTCPLLLERPRGLEWVVNDLRSILNNRRIDKDVDRDFWLAMAELRARLTAGRPVSRGRDFLRYQLVHAMMHQVTTDPEKGIVRVNGMSKAEAVEHLADPERRKSGKEVSPREIYRSLKWVEDYLDKIRNQLEEGQGS